MRTCSGSRGGFAVVAVKCAHLLVMAEDGEGLPPLPTPLQPRTKAIEMMMRAAMQVAS